MPSSRTLKTTAFSFLMTAVLATVGFTAPSAADPVECVTSITTEGEYTVVRFETPGDCVWTAPADVSTIEYVVVGAGGGGGSGGSRVGSCDLQDSPANVRFGGGGAGGAGGQVLSGTFVPTAGDVYTIAVGAGGAGGTTSKVCPAGEMAHPGNAGVAGGQSQIAEVIAIGGGAGDGGTNTGGAGPNGGSLGALFTGANNPLATEECNFDTTTGCFAAPGGAGAGENGFDPALPIGQSNAIWTNGGNGGDGVEVGGVYYGGGGAGATRHCFSHPLGTNRGGGLGGLGGGGNGALVGCSTGAVTGNPGIDNLGGGGGGGRGNGSTAPLSINADSGGDGGDGVVIIKYIPLSADPVVVGEVGEVTKESAKLTWNTTDGDQVTAYKVVVNGVLFDTLAADATSYDMENLLANSLYVIQIIPVVSETDKTPFVLTFHTPKTVRMFVNFEPNRYRLIPTMGAKVKAAFDAIPAGATNISVTITGHVKKIGKSVSARDLKISAGRAKVVKWKFMKLGLNATYALNAETTNSVPYNYGRRADIAITYTPAVVA